MEKNGVVCTIVLLINRFGEFQYQLRVRDIFTVAVFLGVSANAGVVAFPAFNVKHQLKMQVRRPVAVLVRVSKTGYFFIFANRFSGI